MKFYFLIFLFFIVNSKSSGQIRSSQFYSTPLLYNPASTGRFDKSYRVGGSFRNEKNSLKRDFNQSIIFFDTKVLNNLIPENDCMAVGVVGMSENASNEGIKNSYLSFSVGYHKALDESGKSQLSIGFQSTYAHKSITKPNFIFENNLISYLNSGYSNIDIFQFQNVDFSYFDLNAGLIYQGKINDNSLFAIGVSAYHITKPQRIFAGGNFILPTQIWSSVSFEKKLKNENKVYSRFIIGISNKKVDDVNTGLIYEAILNKKNSFLIGGWYRKSKIKGNLIVPSLGLTISDFILNFTYDINIASTTTNQRGANEISLLYTVAKSRDKFLEKRFMKF